jgi:hypothetical protein
VTEFLQKLILVLLSTIVDVTVGESAAGSLGLMVVVVVTAEGVGETQVLLLILIGPRL